MYSRVYITQDILPYLYIMEECSNDDKMYLKVDQLLVHMRAKTFFNKMDLQSLLDQY
jgi:hypothetical protein